MAATPEAPTTPGTTIRPAPLLVEVLLGELLGLTEVVVVSSFEDVLRVKPVDDPLGPGVEEPPGVVDPLISASTVELKVPVMPVRLFPSQL